MVRVTHVHFAVFSEPNDTVYSCVCRRFVDREREIVSRDAKELICRISWSRYVFPFGVVGVVRGFLGGRTNNNPEHPTEAKTMFKAYPSNIRT